ncbi:hypothetical protein CVO77_13935 [Sphingopyxis lindanitolerans]|uniref:Envelope stress response membrane protein PspB n=1 Tax=Sphingopyxis lindanitolerans TaxID=2054227 RepID=A0A2S8B198_9SPHN|nr:hypothetical protein [Sphingopyxis lindanitolerans]PQM26174.1 hypothetical protein CVO77_13935 [Sphingopyxis lindanitolerans]
MENMLYALIPLAPFIVAGLWIWTRHQRKMLDKQSEMTAEKAAQYAAHTERLEERVRVLERIATDRGVDLADEIEKLRDTPPLN